MVESTAKNNVERRAGAAYARDFAPAVAGYIVATLAVTILIDFEGATPWWKYVLALLPVLPALWGVRAVRRHVSRIDEMQKQVLLSAMATGFGVAMVVAITVGFLAMAGLDTNKWGPWLIYAAGMAGWSIEGMRRGAPL